jgi:LacI family transcriptional regulator
MRRIALYMEFSDFYEHGIARGIVRYAKAKPDWRLYGYGWMFRALADIEAWDGDGIIARVEDAKTADRLARIGLPVVDVAGAYSRPNFVSVTNDDMLTGYQAALHLIGCGFRRFAFLGASGTRWSEERRSGFFRAIEEHARPGARWPRFERSLAWWEGGEEDTEDRVRKGTGLAKFLSSLQAPTALFACNDTAGLRAAELAGTLGIAVPESLAILGVDNEDILCELASPSLSSVMLDCEAIGYQASSSLDALLERQGTANRRGSALRPVKIKPNEVVERESTRVFACEDELVARAITYIRVHAQEGIDVSDVLAVVSASRRSLETRFRQALGRSPHEEILRAKLSRAKRLLRETSYTLDRVAEESGFGSLQRFHSAFKAAERVSPGEWRNRNSNAPFSRLRSGPGR